MILGVGVELLEVPRFEAALQRRGDRLLERLFTAAERDYAGRRSQSLAVRFAAKVAGCRALGVAPGRWRELEVVRNENGAPSLRLHGSMAERARRRGVRRSLLSLTHDRHACLGQVILEGMDEGEADE